jgi:membrane protein YdbS with pleckstrin-like domain
MALNVIFTFAGMLLETYSSLKITPPPLSTSLLCPYYFSILLYWFHGSAKTAINGALSCPAVTVVVNLFVK